LSEIKTDQINEHIVMIKRTGINQEGQISD